MVVGISDGERQTPGGLLRLLERGCFGGMISGDCSISLPICDLFRLMITDDTPVTFRLPRSSPARRAGALLAAYYC